MNEKKRKWEEQDNDKNEHKSTKYSRVNSSSIGAGFCTNCNWSIFFWNARKCISRNNRKCGTFSGGSDKFKPHLVCASHANDKNEQKKIVNPQPKSIITLLCLPVLASRQMYWSWARRSLDVLPKGQRHTVSHHTQPPPDKRTDNETTTATVHCSHTPESN